MHLQIKPHHPLPLFRDARDLWPATAAQDARRSTRAQQSILNMDAPSIENGRKELELRPTTINNAVELISFVPGDTTELSSQQRR